MQSLLGTIEPSCVCASNLRPACGLIGSRPNMSATGAGVCVWRECRLLPAGVRVLNCRSVLMCCGLGVV